MNNKRSTRANKKAGRLLRGAAAGVVISSVILCLSLFNASCGGGGGASGGNGAATKQTPEKRVDDVEDNLSSVQRAGFSFIYVIRRPDGVVLTDEDKKYLRGNSPPETNQWRLTEDGKTVIAGSHYKFMPQHLEALRKRFTVENHSKVIEEGEANTTTNKSGGSQNSNGAR